MLGLLSDGKVYQFAASSLGEELAKVQDWRGLFGFVWYFSHFTIPHRTRPNRSPKVGLFSRFGTYEEPLFSFIALIFLNYLASFRNFTCLTQSRSYSSRAIITTGAGGLLSGSRY